MSLRQLLSIFLGSAVVLCAPLLLSAQSLDVPRAEVFGGYSWYHAGGTVNRVDVPDFNEGWGAQFSYNLNHWAGLTADGSGHYNDTGHANGLAFGPQFKLRQGRFVPFGEVLLGFQDFAPKHHPSQTATAYSFGGGLDVRVSNRFSVRAFQVDFKNTCYTALLPAGQTNNFNGVRVQGGVVFNLGLPKVVNTASAACSARPAAVDAGAPVTVAVTAQGFSPRRALSYSYSSTGGKVEGNAMVTTVYTAGLEPGSYTVSAKVVDDGKGHHQQMASCEATFSVRAKHPPALSVSADPASVKSGEVSAITANGISEDNRPLSYQCTATGGRLSGNGSSYTLDTAGVPESTITVDCTVSDDRDLTASANTSVRVNVPGTEVSPQAIKFGTIDFSRDARRPTRVDNEAKGELDRYADALAAAPDAKGVVVGDATAVEAKNVPSFAALRAVNTKDYVTKEKGLDAARIEPRTGSGDDKKTELWIVPPGASFKAAGTLVVDEGKVQAVPRVALKAKKKAHKAHKAAPRPEPNAAPKGN